MKKICLFSAAALMLASCAKDIAEAPSTTPSEDTGNGYVTLTFTATHPERAEVISPEEGEAATKTILNEADGSVKWAKGDKLKLIIEGDEPVFTEEAAISDDNRTATFKATIKEGKAVKYAVYPSTIEATLSGDDLNVTVPKVQHGTFENASIEVGTVGDDNRISLNNVCSLLKFTIANEGAAKVYIGGNGAPFAGTAKVNSGILDADYTDAADVLSYSPNIEINVDGVEKTYYAAVLPAKTTGLSMQIYNGSNEVVAENISSNVLDAKRKTIKNLGTLRNTKFSNVRFAKPNGTGNGSSWDDAISFSKLLSELKNTNFTWHMIFVAGGDCRLAEDFITIKGATTDKKASTFKMYGGFPDNLTGRELTSRDLSKYKTNILGRTTSKATDNRRHFQINDIGNQMTFDGIWFKESYQHLDNSFDLYGGTSLLIGNATAVYCVNCTFDNNQKDGGDGIIRVGTNDGKGVASLKLERCKFSNNTVQRNGLIKIYGGGKVQLTDCDFTEGNRIGGNNICTAQYPDQCVTDGGGNQLGGLVLY